MALPIDKELILEKHCPSMSLLYLDDNGRAFRKRILAAMEEFASAKVIAGATTEAERAQKLVEALEYIIRNGENVRSAYKTSNTPFYVSKAKEALAEWKGAGKEVNDPCPHCGKELSRDRNLCCRECGKEVEG